MTKSNHNKYVSYPDWFGSSTSQPTQQQQVTQTIYYGSGGSSSDSGGTGLTGVITQGSGNAVTSGTLDGNTLVLNKDLTFATDQSNTNSFWELREDLNGKSYLYANYDIATLGGHTMYVDGDDTLSLPGLYDGIPIDNITIYWDTDENGNKVLKSVGTGSGSGGVADKIAWANVYGKPSWITNDKPVYDYSEIQNVPDLSGFVTIEGYQEVKGVKNFLNGIQIANLPITKLNGYEDVIYIDSNVVIRGGLTMYYENGNINLPSIKEEIGIAGYNGNTGLVSFNPEQFNVSANGTVSFIGETSGGESELDTIQLQKYLDSKKYVTEPWINMQGFVSGSTFQTLSDQVQTMADDLSSKVNKSYVDDNFVTLGTSQKITGKKNFTGGLSVNDSPNIYYDKTNKYWKLEGDLLVTGGVTMYSNNSSFVPSTIMDGVTVDEKTISKKNGYLEVIGGTSSGDDVEINDATYTTKGIASFNSSSFTVNNGAVDLKTKVVVTSTTPSSFNSNTLYIIT